MSTQCSESVAEQRRFKHLKNARLLAGAVFYALILGGFGLLIVGANAPDFPARDVALWRALICMLAAMAALVPFTLLQHQVDRRSTHPQSQEAEPDEEEPLR